LNSNCKNAKPVINPLLPRKRHRLQTHKFEQTRLFLQSTVQSQPLINMSAEEVAKAFVAHFYTTFDSNVEGLTTLYSTQSVLTFEGNQSAGVASIMEKLRAIGSVSHEIKTMDVQPSFDASAIIIFVTGHIAIAGGNALHFCEMFQLVSTAPGAYYVHNDVFRLNYGM